MDSKKDIMHMLPSRRLSLSMAFSPGALSFFFLLMVVSVPFVHSSRPSFLGARSVVEQRALIFQELKRNLLKESNGNGGAIFRAEERQVPTGPDPLHHHNSPSRP